MSVAPPKWAKRVKFVTADGKTDPGAKLAWLTLWGYAPLDRAKDDDGENRDPVRVWPTRKGLAEELGESVDTIKGWIKRVTKAGWIRRVGARWELAVCVPFAEGGEYQPDPGPSRPGSQPTRPGSAPTRREGPSQPGEGEHQPAMEDEKKDGKGSRKEAADHARGPVEVDPRQAQHAAIVAQQARLKAEREAMREADKRDPIRAVTAEYFAAIRGAGEVWALLLEQDGGHRRWERKLGEAIRELGADVLTPEAVGAVLRGWLADAEDHGAMAIEAEQVPGVPPKRWIWWPRHRAWLAGKLGLEPKRERGRSRSSTPLGCAKPLKVVSFTERRKLLEQQRQAAAGGAA